MRPRCRAILLLLLLLALVGALVLDAQRRGRVGPPLAYDVLDVLLVARVQLHVAVHVQHEGGRLGLELQRVTQLLQPTRLGARQRPDHQRVLEDVVERRLRQPLAPPPPRLNDELHGLLHPLARQHGGSHERRPRDHSEVGLHLEPEGLPLLIGQQVALVAHENAALRLLAHLVRDGLVLLHKAAARVDHDHRHVAVLHRLERACNRHPIEFLALLALGARPADPGRVCELHALPAPVECC
mmetsp:Transcript_540/g.1279  ORF Transcript_540/g.1279 Transcript_540/m.1279 type:complete len:241 (+) Transcript_540:90-812(+)